MFSIEILMFFKSLNNSLVLTFLPQSSCFWPPSFLSFFCFYKRQILSKRFLHPSALWCTVFTTPLLQHPPPTLHPPSPRMMGYSFKTASRPIHVTHSPLNNPASHYFSPPSSLSSPLLSPPIWMLIENTNESQECRGHRIPETPLMKPGNRWQKNERLGIVTWPWFHNTKEFYIVCVNLQLLGWSSLTKHFNMDKHRPVVHVLFLVVYRDILILLLCHHS